MKERFLPSPATFILLLFVVIGGFFLVLRPWMISNTFRGYTPQMRTFFEQWRAEPLALPPEAITVQPYSAELVVAAGRLSEAWESDNQFVQDLLKRWDIKKWIGEIHRGDADLDSMPVITDKEMADVEAFALAFKQLVTREDYDLESSGAAQGDLNYLAVHLGTKLLELEALRLAQAGSLSEAFDVAGTMLLASRVGPYSLLISRFVGIAMFSISSRTWDLLLRQCDDPVLLREQLAVLNDFAPQAVFMNESLHPMIADQLGLVRRAMRAGAQADLTNVTGAELRAIGLDIQADSIERSGGPATQVNLHRQWAAEARGKFPYIGGIGQIKQVNTFKKMYPNVTEAFVRERVARTYFDLVRVRAARKLYRFERARAPEKLDDLVPDYIPQVPIDRFSRPMPNFLTAPMIPPGPALTYPLSFVQSERGAYSVGPNEVDDGALMLYDPTNGTTSGGDLFFLRPME